MIRSIGPPISPKPSPWLAQSLHNKKKIMKIMKKKKKKKKQTNKPTIKQTNKTCYMYLMRNLVFPLCWG